MKSWQIFYLNSSLNYEELVMIISTKITASWITKKYLQAPILPDSANLLRFLLQNEFTKGLRIHFSSKVFTYLNIFNEIPSKTSRPDHTYWSVNGFVKKINDIIIESAFRNVVTVTASRAPYVFTIERTNNIPK